MLFDKLAGCVERMAQEGTKPLNGSEPLHRIVAGARLFEMPEMDEKALGAGEAFLRESPDLFALPFRTCAVEIPDCDTCTIIRDKGKDSVGLRAEREFMIYLRGESNNIGETWAHCLISGTFHSERHEYGRIDETVGGKVTVESVLTFDSDMSFRAAFTEKNFLNWEKVGACAIALIQASMVRLAYIQLPGNFIVENAPAKPAAAKPGRIIRSHDRSRYIILNPEAVRKILRHPAEPEKGTPKASHWRRRHLRRLQSEHFKAKRGQIIVIPSLWIGPQEAEHGGRKYKVLLDR